MRFSQAMAAGCVSAKIVPEAGLYYKLLFTCDLGMRIGTME
jgi:hypothetical protein